MVKDRMHEARGRTGGYAERDVGYGESAIGEIYKASNLRKGSERVMGKVFLREENARRMRQKAN